LEEVDDTEGEWVIGADDGEIGGFAEGEFEEVGGFIGADGVAEDVGLIGEQPFGGDACVSRGAEDLGDAGGLSELPHERVFATPGTDDKQLHGSGVKQEEGGAEKVEVQSSRESDGAWEWTSWVKVGSSEPMVKSANSKPGATAQETSE